MTEKKSRGGKFCFLRNIFFEGDFCDKIFSNEKITRKR